MTETEVRELYQRMTALWRLDAGKINPAEVVEWCKFLANYGAKGMDAALTAYALDNRLPPKIGDLVRYYRRGQEQRRQAAEYTEQGKVYRCPYCLDSGVVCVDRSHKGEAPMGVKCHCRYPLPEPELQKRQQEYEFIFLPDTRGYWQHISLAEKAPWLGDLLDLQAELPIGRNIGGRR